MPFSIRQTLYGAIYYGQVYAETQASNDHPFKYNIILVRVFIVFTIHAHIKSHLIFMYFKTATHLTTKN